MTTATFSAGASAEVGALPTPEQIIDRYIDALGGRVALEKLYTRVCTGHIITDLTWKTPRVEALRFEAYAEVPSSILFTTHSEDETWREGFDGQTGWLLKDGELTLDESTDGRKLDWLLNPQNALRIEEYFPELALSGLESVAGRPAYVLVPAGMDPAHYSFFFDTETGLLLGIGYHTEVHDYRCVGGVLFPYRFVFGRKGGSTSYVFDDVLHNVPLDDKLFEVPAAPSMGCNG
jgi:hypothetical protein